jgi:hypothetical protein
MVVRASIVAGSLRTGQAVGCRYGGYSVKQKDERDRRRAHWMTLATVAPMGADPVTGLPAVAS